MKIFITILFILLSSVFCYGQSSYFESKAIPLINIKIAWTAPTTNSDGTPLTDLDGYKVYRDTIRGGKSNVIVINDSAMTEALFTNLLPNTAYFFFVTAFNTSGDESVNSDTLEVRSACTTSVVATSCIGTLMSRLKHAVMVKYDGESMKIPSRGNLQEIDKNLIEGTLPKGVFFKSDNCP